MCFIFNLRPIPWGTTRGLRGYEMERGKWGGGRWRGNRGSERERWVRDESTVLHYKISWWSPTVAYSQTPAKVRSTRLSVLLLWASALLLPLLHLLCLFSLSAFIGASVCWAVGGFSFFWCLRSGFICWMYPWEAVEVLFLKKIPGGV